MSPRVARIRDAVEKMHLCTARHVGSEPVVEFDGGKVVWGGVVETFELGWHPQAKRCHAWSTEESGEMRVTVILEVPPVSSPETAVKVAIASKSKKAFT